jgi:tetratricopeptide (TPR) repeat protein
MKGMFRPAPILFAAAMLTAGAWAQDSPSDPTLPVKKQPNLPANAAIPRSEDPVNEPYRDEDGLIHRGSGEFSSSKEEPADITPPRNDAKEHPDSAQAVREAEDAAGLLEGDELGGIQEFRPFDPHKAAKDIEVGDFYFKRKNYRAALDRYQEALYYKNNDAVAMFKLGVCQEQLGEYEEARKAYNGYLDVLPEGPFAADAKQGLVRMNKALDDTAPPQPSKAVAKPH